jgi:phospholipid transport system substrate-binding protein
VDKRKQGMQVAAASGFARGEKYVKALIALVFAAVAVLAPAAGAAELSPDGMVKSITDDVLSVIRANKDKRTLRETAEQKVLPNFDFRAMTQLAVGRYWRDANPSQQKALEDAFRSLLVNTYTASLAAAATGKETVDVKPAEAKGNEALVRTVVRAPGRQPIAVDYRLSKQGEGWKVYDVIVENLSLVTNYRSTFASEIGRSGIDGLVKALEAKNREIGDAKG